MRTNWDPRPLPPPDTLMMGHDVPQCPVAHPTSCALCAAHYGDNGVCDEGKPVRSPHRIGGGVDGYRVAVAEWLK